MRGRAVTGATHFTDRVNRTALTLLGLLLAALGGYGLARGWGAFGDRAADEPLLLESLRDVARTEGWFWPAAAVAAALAAFAGLAWLRAQLAPATTGEVDLTHREDAGTTVVQPAGAARALSREIETYRGVTQASARLTGSNEAPEVDLRVDVTDDCNLADLRSRIDSEALPHLEQAIDLAGLAATVEFRITSESGRRLR